MSLKASIVAFSGHMIDAPTRPMPRFPLHRVDAVSAAIQRKLAERDDPLVGVCSGADGGDCLFMEAVLARRGSVFAILPFPIEAFKGTSVRADWRPRLDAILASPRVELRSILRPTLPSTQEERDRAFADVNTTIMQTAQSLAESMHDAAPWFLAVYQTAQTNKVGGTGDAFQAWKDLGHRLELIDPMRV